jgi:hypothetical protein
MLWHYPPFCPQALHVLDIFFTAAFGIEMVLKIIVQGLLFNGRGSYMRRWVGGGHVPNTWHTYMAVLLLVFQPSACPQWLCSSSGCRTHAGCSCRSISWSAVVGKGWKKGNLHHT